MAKDSPWWDARVHADRRPFLLARGKVRDALRGYFLEQGFVEVEAGQMQVSPGNETHLHAFATELLTPDGGRERRYLHTSPEFACKKLLAAGERKIFDFARVFRNRERGALHAPEFTMLEWYRAQESYDVLMQDCAALLSAAARATGVQAYSFRGRSADPFTAPERISMAQAFQKFASMDLAATLSENSCDRDALARQALASGIDVAGDDTWSDIFSKVLVARIEPNLGNGRATILDEYPTIEAALARPTQHDLRFAQRFEIFVCGVELANGFGELTDARDQHLAENIRPGVVGGNVDAACCRLPRERVAVAGIAGERPREIYRCKLLKRLRHADAPGRSERIGTPSAKRKLRHAGCARRRRQQRSAIRHQQVVVFLRAIPF
ncbi:MAG TPA: amino acid--tRNA ligase-related protein, partial [Xanthobacteraceae bacterium]|nr:amino acid--tRNA ligase-related protein [Xanthobacteraceae bacterium]